MRSSLKTIETELSTEQSAAGQVRAPQQSFDLNSQKAIYRSFRKTITSAKNRQDLFVNLTCKLDKFFAIHKGSFAICDNAKNYMRVPIVFQEGETKSGLVISIAGDKSLMRNVLRSGKIHIEDFPRYVVGNIVERKILLLDETNSLAIVPLWQDGVQLGTMNFASPAPSAFSIFSSHLFDFLFMKVAQKFAVLGSR